MRNFVNTQNKNLHRDADGHRTGFKVYIKVRKPMSDEGFKRWSTALKVHIGKSRTIWEYYTSSSALNYKDGIPIEYCKTDKALITWMITFAGCGAGETYAIHSWRGLSAKHKIPVLTRAILVFTIQDVEKISFKIIKSNMGRYWFRKEQDKHHIEVGE